MRVTAIELFAVPPRWLFPRLSTDSGIAGWGEPIVEGRAATAAAAVQELSEHVIGSDPFRIEDLSRSCGGAASTAAGPCCAARSPGSSRRRGTSSAGRSACRPGSCSAGGRATASGCTAGSAPPGRGAHYNEAPDLLDHVRDASVFDVVDGHKAVPAGPGPGVDIDEERVRAAAEGAPPWRNPVWRNADGTVAAW